MKDYILWWMNITESEAIAMVIVANDLHPYMYSVFDFNSRIVYIHHLFSKYIK